MPVVLIIAGVDPSGGAGLVADVAVVTARGLHPAAIPTALTLQDSRACREVAAVDPAWIARELALLVEDLPIAAVKLGMLATVEVARVVAEGIAPLRARGCPVVLDPVLRATVGAALLDGDVVEALAPLWPLVTIATPNSDEAARLCGVVVDGQAGQKAAAAALRAKGARAVLVKGGHVPGERVSDLLDDGGVLVWLASERLAGEPSHGTGCALSTEIACGLAVGETLRIAVERARRQVVGRIGGASRLGKGRPFLAPPGIGKMPR